MILVVSENILYNTRQPQKHKVVFYTFDIFFLNEFYHNHRAFLRQVKLHDKPNML